MFGPLSSDPPEPVATPGAGASRIWRGQGDRAQSFLRTVFFRRSRSRSPIPGVLRSAQFGAAQSKSARPWGRTSTSAWPCPLTCP